MVIVHILLSGEKIKKSKAFSARKWDSNSTAKPENVFQSAFVVNLSIESLWTLPLILSVRGVGK